MVFPAVNVIYEEAKNIDISQLEFESERLMESIAQMDQKNQERMQSRQEKRLSKSITIVEKNEQKTPAFTKDDDTKDKIDLKNKSKFIDMMSPHFEAGQYTSRNDEDLRRQPTTMLEKTKSAQRSPESDKLLRSPVKNESKRPKVSKIKF